jgi:hypothetical protein
MDGCTSFWAIDGDLADDFIEALAEQFFANRADSRLTCLPGQQSFIEQFLEIRDILPRGGGMRDILDEMFGLVIPLAWRQDGIQDVLTLNMENETSVEGLLSRGGN